MTPTTHPTADAVALRNAIRAICPKDADLDRADYGATSYAEGFEAALTAAAELVKIESERAAIQPSGEPTGLACRMQGGICACRSGGSFGGCAIERGIVHQGFTQPVHPVAAPDGYVLVPIVPTEDMIEKADQVEDLYRRGTPQTWASVYSAMLRAAPASAPVEATICAGPCKNDPDNPCPGCPYGKNWDGDDEPVEAVSVRDPIWWAAPGDAEWYYPATCSFLRTEGGKLLEWISGQWKPSAMTPHVAHEDCSWKRPSALQGKPEAPAADKLTECRQCGFYVALNRAPAEGKPEAPKGGE